MTNLFAAASAPSVLIGRSQEMKEIHHAIYAPGDDLRVVYLVGDGGLGKSRLLAEIKRAVETKEGDPKRSDLHWWKEGQTIQIAEVLDMEPVRLSTTLRFVNDLVAALDPKREHFRRFRLEHARHRQALVFQSSYERIQAILHDALRAFGRDYMELSRQGRIVLLLDTAEKFTVPIPPYFDLKAEYILGQAQPQEGRPADTPIYTRDWLRRLLVRSNESSWLKNTTIIMAGRPQAPNAPGAWWEIFAGLDPKQVMRRDIEPLTAEEIPAYFHQLAADLENQVRFPPSSEHSYTIRRLKRFTDPDAAWTLWAYTDGQPVRLALVADLIIDGAIEPPQIDQSKEKTQKELGWDEQQKVFLAQGDWRKAKEDLGKRFIETLFDSSANLRARILARLVRAHHPLDAPTLEFLIDSLPGEHYHSWLTKQRSSPERVKAIEQELLWLRHLAFFKSRMNPYGVEGELQLQVFLQDVLYEIFDDYFGQADPSSRKREINERKDIYTKLMEVLNSRIQTCEKALRQTWLDERWALEDELRAQSVYAPLGMRALRARFPNPNEMPMLLRSRYSREELRDWFEDLHLEKLYYALRINPRTAINDDYGELADGAWLEHDEDFMTQIEIQAWRLLQDSTAHKLVDLAPHTEVDEDRMRSNPERYDPWQRLARVVYQDHALRWLKRFHLRGRYDEVGKMAEVIRRFARAVKRDPGGDEASPPSSPYHSWNHTLTQQETRVYEGYALAYTGETGEAIRILRKAVSELEAVFDPGHPRRGEKAFDLPGQAVHLAANRVRRVIGIAQFVLGYAYAAQGNFDLSHAAYNNALPHLRRTSFVSLEVYCRFNRARVLAELGYTGEAVKNCEDALNLLTNSGKGGTLPFAYASNTLALVYNAERTLDPAWLNAAVAHACFQRMAEERGIALAEMQFGESLRRMADIQDRQEYSPDRATPKLLYQESESVLNSAYNRILSHPVLSREGQRRAEAAIELASSLRDQVRVIDIESKAEIAREMLRKAESLFDEADSVAETIGHNLLRLDARWGKATLLYRASRTGLGRFHAGESGPIPGDELIMAFKGVARAALDFGVIAGRTWIEENNRRPHRKGSQVRAVRRLGRIYGRLGRIYAEEFARRSNEVREEHRLLPYVAFDDKKRRDIQEEVLKDKVACDYLQKMAEHYVIALGYAQMYNPNAALGEYLTGDLYDRVKTFNDATMLRFTQYLQAAERAFHVSWLQAAPRDSVQEVLKRSFGKYEQSNTRRQQGTE